MGGGYSFKWLCLEVKTMFPVIKFLAWCQNRKILVRQERAKLKYGIILFSSPEYQNLLRCVLCKFSHSSLQQERICTHLRKACILEKSQDLNFINKQEGFLPFLGEPTGSPLIHTSRDHHRSRLFQHCIGLEETRKNHQLIKKIN